MECEECGGQLPTYCGDCQSQALQESSISDVARKCVVCGIEESMICGACGEKKAQKCQRCGRRKVTDCTICVQRGLSCAGCGDRAAAICVSCHTKDVDEEEAEASVGEGILRFKDILELLALKMRISTPSKKLAKVARRVDESQQDYLSRLGGAIREEMGRGDATWEDEKDKLKGKKNAGRKKFANHPGWLTEQIKLLKEDGGRGSGRER